MTQSLSNLTDLYGVGPKTAEDIRDEFGDVEAGDILEAYVLGNHDTMTPTRLTDTLSARKLTASVRRAGLTNEDLGIDDGSDIGVEEMLFVRHWGAASEFSGNEYGSGRTSAFGEVSKDDTGLLVGDGGEAGISRIADGRYNWDRVEAYAVEELDKSWATFLTFHGENNDSIIDGDAYTTVKKEHVGTAVAFFDTGMDGILERATMYWCDEQSRPLTLRGGDIEIAIAPWNIY